MCPNQTIQAKNICQVHPSIRVYIYGGGMVETNAIMVAYAHNLIME